MHQMDTRRLSSPKKENFLMNNDEVHIIGAGSGRIEDEHRHCIGITRNDAGEIVTCLDQHSTQYESEEDQVSVRLDNKPNSPNKCVTCREQTEFYMCTNCRRNAPDDIGPGRIDYSVREIK